MSACCRSSPAPDRAECPPYGTAEKEVVMDDDGKRRDRFYWIRTVLAGIKLVLWILWVLFDPRHPF
jgi:hypothetical protein